MTCKSGQKIAQHWDLTLPASRVSSQAFLMHSIAMLLMPEPEAKVYRYSPKTRCLMTARWPPTVSRTSPAKAMTLTECTVAKNGTSAATGCCKATSAALNTLLMTVVFCCLDRLF